MKNNEYTLGDAIMEERKAGAKYEVRRKLDLISKVIADYQSFTGDYCEIPDYQITFLREQIQEILNIVENEL